MEVKDWVLVQDEQGRSLPMSLLADGVDALETVRIFTLASKHPRWKQCLALEDIDGVRLQAYMLRYGIRRHLEHGSWVDAVFEGSNPISTRGHGLLKQLATLASKTSRPDNWILDLTVVRPQSCMFSPDQWQRGLVEAQVRSWLLNRAMAINYKTYGTLNGPASPDLHFFYNTLVAFDASVYHRKWLSRWDFGLGQAIEVILGIAGSAHLTKEQKRAWWVDRESAVEALSDCFPQGKGVAWAILNMAGDGMIWEDMMARINSRQVANALEHGLGNVDISGEGKVGRRL